MAHDPAIITALEQTVGAARRAQNNTFMLLTAVEQMASKLLDGRRVQRHELVTAMQSVRRFRAALEADDQTLTGMEQLIAQLATPATTSTTDRLPQTKRCPSCGWTMRLDRQTAVYACSNQACDCELEQRA